MIWIDTIIQGILLGGLYCLLATGLTLIFGIMRIVNLAHGDFIVLAAYLILTLMTFLGFSPLVAALVATLFMFGMGYAFQYFLLNRVLNKDILPPILVTFGLSIILQNLMLEFFSADSRRISLENFEIISLRFFGISIGLFPLLTFLSAILIIVIINWIFFKTELGRAFRAVSDDLETSRIMGINHKQLYAITTAMAMVVMTVTAFYLGNRANFDPAIGPARLIYSFQVVIIAGLGSLWGTLLGGIILGLAQTIGAQINPEWQILAGHIAFILFLLWKPSGFFPKTID